MKRIPILAVALVLILAACAGDSDTGAAQSDTQATTTTVSETATTVAETTTTGEHMDDEGMHEDDDHAAAGGLEIITDGTPAEREIEVVQTEFAFEPNPVSVRKGEIVTFTVRNDGSIPHEFRITNHEAAETHLAAGHGDHDEEIMAGEPMVMDGDLVLLLDPGQAASITVKFDEDANYDLIACLLPGHFEAGMAAPLELES